MTDKIKCQHCGALLIRSEGQRIKRAREGKGMTQAQLASATGLARTTIVNIEKNNHRATIKVLIEICKALDVSADWILGLK